ncbi:zinc-ribbon domain-containing protein [Clostridium sp. MSJ-4]|uniref:Zinc-ribbon domain-containing protein n=1 Tax=Clostridium simiarum TaxID=2841506 RepID=A0ABS6F2L4_9CLOT|nr:zinc-ribbon domain-containing protein [Clostridium simiarum]
MICPKCGSENSDESLFCNKCGAKLETTNVDNIDSNEMKNDIADNEKNHKKVFKDKIKFHINKKNVILSCSVLVIIIFVVSGIIYFNNPISKYKSDIRNNKQTEAARLYNDKIKGNSDNENKINSFLKSELLDIVNSFKNEEIDFNKAKDRIDTIKSTGLISIDVNNAIDNVNNLNNSRIAFKKADEFLKNNNLINAIKEYKNVISDDKNYEKAKEQINNNEKKYKEQVLKSAEEFANKKDYDEAVEILSEAIVVFSNDADLTSKNEIYEKLQQEKLETEKIQKIEEAKNKQELVVVSSSVVSDYFNINDQAKVIVKNNTNKVVKKFTIGILMYDGNGYPLKSGTLAGENELFKGKAESVNIQAGKTFGDSSAWNLYTNYGTVAKLNACVMYVEYYDGDKWTNDYYNYWKDEYLGKPYK